MSELSHLDELEAEAIYIIREVAAECEKTVMLYSIGKDSSVMLHLAMKAFYPEKSPFPFLHVNTGWKFKEMIEFRAKERIFSFRNEAHAWDPKNQRPKMWKLYNAKNNKGESIRVFPISNWTEKDIWQYIERENIDVAYRYFTTDKRSFIVADTPGYEEYTRNMAVGASFADLAIILIDAKQGVLVQTRRHARICSLMGIRYFVFAVNKMDLIGYDEARFREIEAQIAELTKELKLPNVKVIPVSATEGDNVTKKSENITWYQGEALLT